jgi:hypothetical protein
MLLATPEHLSLTTSKLLFHLCLFTAAQCDIKYYFIIFVHKLQQRSVEIVDIITCACFATPENKAEVGIRKESKETLTIYMMP